MQPMVIPVMIGQSQPQPQFDQHFLSEIRESINQAIGDKLSLAQVHQTHNLHSTNTDQLRQKTYLDEAENQ